MKVSVISTFFTIILLFCFINNSTSFKVFQLPTRVLEQTLNVSLDELLTDCEVRNANIKTLIQDEQNESKVAAEKMIRNLSLFLKKWPAATKEFTLNVLLFNRCHTNEFLMTNIDSIIRKSISCLPKDKQPSIFRLLLGKVRYILEFCQQVKIQTMKEYMKFAEFNQPITE